MSTILHGVCIQCACVWFAVCVRVCVAETLASFYYSIGSNFP